MRKKIIVKLLVLSLLVWRMGQWSGGSKAKRQVHVLYGTGLTKVRAAEAGIVLKCIIRVEN